MLQGIICLACYALAFTTIHAQDYRAVYRERIAIFKDDYHIQARTLIIDSVGYRNGDSVLYPIRNLRETDYGLTPQGPSWIGEQIIEKQNGTTVFLNYNHDSTILNTNARLSDKWELFRNTSLVITAEVTGIDTMTFLGLTDSVKNIKLSIKGGESPIDNILHNKSILLSKNFGLIQTPNFYFIPDLVSFTNEQEQPEMLRLIGLTNPEAGVQNFTWLDVYDFQPGDELHIYSTSSHGGTPYSPFSFRNEKTIKKYLSRQDSINSVFYDVVVTIGAEGSQNNQNYSVYSCDTIHETYKSNPEFDKYPGVPVIISWGFVMNLSDGVKSVPGCIVFNEQSDTIWNMILIDGMCCTYNYHKGLGGPYSICSDGYINDSQDKIVYYKKGSTTWGTPLVITSVDKEPETGKFEVFPNPAGDVLYVKLNDPGYSNYRLTILNLQGQAVYTNDHYTEGSPVDVVGLKGVYMIKAETPVRSGVRKVVIE